MANTRELRRRIKSIKNTSQITKAMQMVAATKMRRAQNQALNSRPYTEALNFSLSKLIGRVSPEAHRFLTGNDSKVTGVMLFSTDKGLVGALNTNLLRAVTSQAVGANTNYYTVGKKGRNYVVRMGKDLEADFENDEIVTFREAKQIAKLLIAEFLSGKLMEIYLIYPHFVSALRQEPTVIRLLPISISEVEAEKTSEVSASEFLFEPSVDELLDSLLVHSIETKIYQALLETKACEHSARMMAMQNATDNAKDLVSDLQLTYNQTRQDAITRELLEITSAGLALQ